MNVPEFAPLRSTNVTVRYTLWAQCLLCPIVAVTADTLYIIVTAQVRLSKSEIGVHAHKHGVSRTWFNVTVPCAFHGDEKGTYSVRSYKREDPPSVLSKEWRQARAHVNAQAR